MPSSWLCIDANLVIRLVADPADDSIRRVWEQWDAERRQLAAPTLLYYKVTNALHRYQKLGLMSASSVRLALKAALSLPIHLHGEAVCPFTCMARPICIGVPWNWPSVFPYRLLMTLTTWPWQSG
jgi:hypothetical protein